jgi:hypothetical protein
MPEDIILRTFEEADLYLSPQVGFPHALVARYRSDGDYTSFNPSLTDDSELQQQSAAIREAYLRARALGYGR